MWLLVIILLLVPAHFRGVFEYFLGSFLSNVLAVTGLAASAILALCLYLPARWNSPTYLLVPIVGIAGLISALLTILSGRVGFVLYYAVPFLSILAIGAAFAAVGESRRRIMLKPAAYRLIEAYLIGCAFLSVALQVVEAWIGQSLLVGSRTHDEETIRSAGLAAAPHVHGILTAMLAIYFLVQGLGSEKLGKYIRLTASTILAAASVFSYTRSGVFILVVFFLFGVALRPLRLFLNVVAPSVVVFFLGLAIIPAAYVERTLSTFNPSGPGNTGRIEQWIASWQKLMETPLLISNQFGAATQATRPFWPIYGGFHYENFFWSFMVNIGIPGAAFFYLLLLLAAARFGPYMMAFVIAVLLHSMVYMTLESTAVLATLLLVAISWESTKRRPEKLWTHSFSTSRYNRVARPDP